MASSSQLFTDLSCLHHHFLLQKIGERGFPHSGRTRHGRGLSSQDISERLRAFPLGGTCEQNLITTGSIDFLHPACFLSVSQVLLVKTDDHGNLLTFHNNQKAVQQREIGFRLPGGKYHQRLIHIGNCRADQLILSGKDIHHISQLFLFIQDLNLHIVTHKGLYFFFSEYSFCLTFINSGFCYFYVVESGNSFDNLSLH